MNTSGLMGGLYQFCVWVTRLVYINLLWIVFSLLGLGVLGIFPATAALFSVIRRWVLRENEEIKVFPTFWNAYKSSFKDSQFIGYILTAIGALLYFDYHFFTAHEGPIFFAIKIVTLGAIFIFIMIALYIFPLYAHFQLKLFTYFKNAFFIGLSQLLISILMVISTVILFYALMRFSGFLFIFGLTLPAFWVTWLSHLAFRRVEKIKPLNQE
ncbi:YesL family protein [Fredinandcohnia salidurans]|uniref:YesL family protein n=1 Tax=Fredinandcohnia salidurans TaxID=2595041 RepID=A0ABW4MSY1_9BACI|nr:YesL family protein [Fredinandcohnia onubensis]